MLCIIKNIMSINVNKCNFCIRIKNYLWFDIFNCICILSKKFINICFKTCSLRFGRQFNFARDYLNPLTPFSGGDFARASTGINFATGGTERLSNTLKFESADLSGFKFGLGYSFSAQIPSAYISDGNNGDAGTGIDLSLNVSVFDIRCCSTCSVAW